MLYIKNKLYPYTADYNTNQIEKRFLDPVFSTKNKVKSFINREMIRTLKNKVFIPANLPDNNYTRLWVKKTLKKLDILPNDKLLAILIAKRR